MLSGRTISFKWFRRPF